jgi:hypothetical protein
VNFGQYLNSAYMPYMPSKIHRKIPDAGSDGEKVGSLFLDSHSKSASLLSLESGNFPKAGHLIYKKEGSGNAL